MARTAARDARAMPRRARVRRNFGGMVTALRTGGAHELRGGGVTLRLGRRAPSSHGARRPSEEAPHEAPHAVSHLRAHVRLRGPCARVCSGQGAGAPPRPEAGSRGARKLIRPVRGGRKCQLGKRRRRNPEGGLISRGGAATARRPAPCDRTPAYLPERLAVRRCRTGSRRESPPPWLAPRCPATREARGSRREAGPSPASAPRPSRSRQVRARRPSRPLSARCGNIVRPAVSFS